MATFDSTDILRSAVQTATARDSRHQRKQNPQDLGRGQETNFSACLLANTQSSRGIATGAVRDVKIAEAESGGESTTLQT